MSSQQAILAFLAYHERDKAVQVGVFARQDSLSLTLSLIRLALCLQVGELPY